MVRTKEQQREYMKAYRARKTSVTPVANPTLILSADLPAFIPDWDGIKARDARIAELEEEVRHLKEELARRPDFRNAAGVDRFEEHTYSTRPFTPVPKR